MIVSVRRFATFTLNAIDVDLDARELLESLRLTEAWAREHGLPGTALQAARVVRRLEQA